MNKRSARTSIGSGVDQMSPVILLGAGRSGTKFVRNMLATSPEVAAIPFDINYVWRYGNEGAQYDVLDPTTATPEKIDAIRRTLGRLARIDAKPEAHVLLEKTISNTLRVPFVEAVLPEARYLHLIRDGRAVAESAARVWYQPPEKGYLFQKLRYFPWRNYRYGIWYVRNTFKAGSRKKIWGVWYPGVDRDLENYSLLEVCARQWQESVERTRSSLSALPAERVMEVRYEELLGDADTICAICRFCGIVTPGPVVDAFNANVDSGHRDKWRCRLDEAQMKLVLSTIRDTLVACGYDPS